MLRNRSGRPRSVISSTRARGAGQHRDVRRCAARAARGRATSAGERERRRRAGQPAGEEVPGHLRLPHRRLDHRPPVVGARLGPRTMRSSRSRSPPAPDQRGRDARRPARRRRRPPTRQIRGGARVVTTGSGGSPYTSGSSSSRKKAPKPPTPSPGSAPYSRARSLARHAHALEPRRRRARAARRAGRTGSTRSGRPSRRRARSPPFSRS